MKIKRIYQKTIFLDFNYFELYIIKNIILITFFLY